MNFLTGREDGGDGGDGGDDGLTFSVALSPIDKQIRKHALLCSIGFIVLLPLGSLVARYLRTFTRSYVSFSTLILHAYERILSQMVLGPCYLPISHSWTCYLCRMGIRYVLESHVSWSLRITHTSFSYSSLGYKTTVISLTCMMMKRILSLISERIEYRRTLR